MGIITFVFITINMKYVPGPNNFKGEYELLSSNSIFNLLKENNIISDDKYLKENFDIKLNYKLDTNDIVEIELFRNSSIEKMIVNHGNKNALFEKNINDNYMFNYLKNLNIYSNKDKIIFVFNTVDDTCVKDDGFIQIYTPHKSLRIFNILKGYYDNNNYVDLDYSINDQGFNYYSYESTKHALTKIHLYDVENIKEKSVLDIIENIDLCKK